MIARRFASVATALAAALTGAAAATVVLANGAAPVAQTVELRTAPDAASSATEQIDAFLRTLPTAKPVKVHVATPAPVKTAKPVVVKPRVSKAAPVKVVEQGAPAAALPAVEKSSPVLADSGTVASPAPAKPVKTSHTSQDELPAPSAPPVYVPCALCPMN